MSGEDLLKRHCLKVVDFKAHREIMRFLNVRMDYFGNVRFKLIIVINVGVRTPLIVKYSGLNKIGVSGFGVYV